MAPKITPVVGPPMIGASSGSTTVPERMEIRELYKDTQMWELFLLGLLSFQKSFDEKSPQTSYARIAGIHGAPYETPWNEVDRAFMGKKNVPPNPNRKGGYCMHSSNLFATWHRPYVALFEQELYKHVQKEAANYNLSAKAVNFRLPYWDWGLQRGKGDLDAVYPTAIFGKKTVDIHLSNPPKTIRNPLASFQIDEHSELAGTSFKIPQQATGPSEGPTWRNVRKGAWGIKPSDVMGLLLARNGKIPFNTFCTGNSKVATTGVEGYSSLEALHDGIHSAIGGHMGFLATAANVDRLLAMYQALWPNNRMDGFTEVGGGLTTDTNELLNETTKLLGYQSIGLRLPGDIRRDPPRPPGPSEYHTWLEKKVSSYGSDSLPPPRRVARTAMRRRMEMEPEPEPGPEPEPEPVLRLAGDNQGTINSTDTNNPIGIPATEAQNTFAGPLGAATTSTSAELQGDSDSDTLLYDLWTANIRTEKHGLGQPYDIFIMLGSVPADPKTWDTHSHTVNIVAVLGQDADTGCEKCAVDMTERLCITATVSLTEALVEHLEDEGKSLTAMDDDSVAAYLQEQLHWRVALKGRTEVPRERVPGLKVVVSAVTMQLDENGVPVYDDDGPRLFVDVTRGRPAGCGSVDEV
ncbi:hypothetical protein OQA88_8038 [Cercophora sp. LCS_1]